MDLLVAVVGIIARGKEKFLLPSRNPSARTPSVAVNSDEEEKKTSPGGESAEAG